MTTTTTTIKRSFTNLQEALNRPYKWRRGVSTATRWSAEFTTSPIGKKKFRYVFQAAAVQKKNNNNRNREMPQWEVEFILKNPSDGKGDTLGKAGDVGGSGAMRVFATVIQIFEVFVKENSPDGIKFTADKTEEGARPGTRAKLYTRFAKKFARAYKYDLKIKDNVIDVDFFFIKKKKEQKRSL